ncbi:MAG: hypothetical protein SW833_21320 [Cyanobacteriota bacterium]|nr:hypothetical protein [Cyanobacteriota bacterium]
MTQHSPKPKFSILMAQLKRHQIDCYKIAKTQYYFCTHRPSSSRCLIHWQQNEWKLAGDAKVPAYKIAQWVLNKLANCLTATEKELQPPTAELQRLEEIAP